MKIKWSLDINTGAVERSEAARARRLAGATVVGDDVIASTGYIKKQPLTLHKLKVLWMTIVKSGWNVWVWLVGVVSRRRMWLVGVGESMGVVSRR